jgi:hypothetical protein
MLINLATIIPSYDVSILVFPSGRIIVLCVFASKNVVYHFMSSGMVVCYIEDILYCQ